MRKFQLLFAGCLLTFFLFSSSPAEAFSPFNLIQSRNSIGGYVFDQQRRPVAQVYVELRTDVYSTLARVRTDGSGRFIFNNVPAGRFSVRVLPYGTDFEEQSQDVQIVNLVVRGRSAAIENVQMDFYLRVRKTDADLRSVPGVVFVQDVPQQAEESYKKAVAELEEKKVEAGIAELQNALKSFPDYFLALERLGNEFNRLQKYADARDIYKKAVTVNPRSYASWYGLGYASYALQQSEEAVEAAEKAVSLNSNSIEALLILGISERQVKQYEKAEKTLKQASKLAKGKSADAHWNLALLYAHNLKRYKDAADHLELYLKIDPNVPNAEAVKKLIKQFREKSGS